MTKYKVSLVMASFQRAHLLELGLSSIVRYKIDFPLEVIVVNDGPVDNTEAVVNSFRDGLNIKYIFSGHRNKDGIKSRNPVFANNIGIKAASGDIVVLSCPEIYHLNDCLDVIVKPLLNSNKLLTIPEFMYFDDTGEFTNNVNSSLDLLSVGSMGKTAVQMTFLMGVWKKELVDIGGYDEDFIGYGSDDNDLVDRLKLNRCRHFRVPARIVHLYHGPRCDSHIHWDNPAQVYNYKLINSRRGQIVRNIGREWGKLCK